MADIHYTEVGGKSYWIDGDDYTKTIPFLMRNCGIPQVLAEALGFELTISEVLALTPTDVENRVHPVVIAMEGEVDEEGEPIDTDHILTTASFAVYQLLHPELLWAEKHFLNWAYTPMHLIFSDSTDKSLIFSRVKYEWIASGQDGYLDEIHTEE